MSSSPGVPAPSVRPSSPNSSATATPSSRWPARTTSAASLTAAGAEVLRGTLSDLDVLRDGVRRSDGVIHLAFGHDAATPDALAREIVTETAALAAMGDELARQRPAHRRRLRHAVDRGPRVHRGRPAADRRAGRGSWPRGGGPAGSRVARRAQPRGAHSAHCARRRKRRIRRASRHDGAAHRCRGLPRRRHATLARRARARCRRPVPAGPGIRAAGHVVARRRRGGRRGARHRGRHRTSTRSARATGAARRSSARSARSSSLINRRRVATPATSSVGAPRIPGCSRISRTCVPEHVSIARVACG